MLFRSRVDLLGDLERFGVLDQHARGCAAPGADHDQAEDEAEASHRLNLLGRRTTVEEVADAAWFLATGPMASGQALFVDSGQHLLSQLRDVMYLAREEWAREERG